MFNPQICWLMGVAIAVIAGAGPGLGFSLAKQFAGEYKVVLLSRNQDRLDVLANEIKKGGGEVNLHIELSKKG